MTVITSENQQLENTSEIESVKDGSVLELAVEGTREIENLGLERNDKTAFMQIIEGIEAEIIVAPAAEPQAPQTEVPARVEEFLNTLNEDMRDKLQRLINEDGKFHGIRGEELIQFLDSDRFQNASQAVREQLAGLIASGGPVSAMYLQELVRDGIYATQFQALSNEQQQQFLNVFSAADVSGRMNLMNLLKMPRPAGEPQEHGAVPRLALLSTDADGNTLLHNLNRLATAPINPAILAAGETRESILSGVIQESGRPGEVNQSSRGTCTVTSMQWILCQTQPAEYARIVSGLISPEGTVTLRGGQQISLNESSIAPDDTDRTPAERFFQSALMDLGAATHGEFYSNITDARHSNGMWGRMNAWIGQVVRDVGGQPILPERNAGLYDSSAHTVFSALMGEDHTVYRGHGSFWSSMSSTIGHLFEGSYLEALNSMRPSYHVLNHLRETPGPHYVHMLWGDAGEEGLCGGHAVVVTEVRDGRVYFRNPWGPSGDAPGTEYNDPARRMEDNSIGLESMTEQEFMNWISCTVTPSRTLNN